MKAINALFDWVEYRLEQGWMRRAYLAIATLMLWKVTEWAMIFAQTSKLSGSDIALIIGAASVPASAVAKFAFDAYLDSRKRGTDSMSTTTTTVESTK